jgi:hypothetical protein
MQGGHYMGHAGQMQGGRAWAFTREETNLGDTWGDANDMVICTCGEMQEEIQGSSQVQTAFSPS